MRSLNFLVVVVVMLVAVEVYGQNMPVPERGGAGPGQQPVVPVPDQAKEQAAELPTPRWSSRSSETMASARVRRQPILVVFANSEDLPAPWMSQAQSLFTEGLAVAVFVATSDARESAVPSTVVPACKLLSADPASAYRLSRAALGLIVCDWHGNECVRYVGRMPDVAGLKRKLVAVPDLATRAAARAASRWAEAEKCRSNNDGRTELTHLLKTFRDDRTGFLAVEAAVERYAEVMAQARRELAQAATVEELQRLLDLYKGSDVDGEIRQAIRRLQPRVPETEGDF